MPKFWIGVACRAHVEAAVRGEFCQFCHGRRAPAQSLEKGDELLYYSPAIELQRPGRLQQFTTSSTLLVATNDPSSFTTGCPESRS